MKRRNFLKLTGAATATGAATLAGCSDRGEKLPKPSAAPLDANGNAKIAWQNWSGYERCYPDARVAPRSVEDVASLLKNAKGTVRPVGAGHSFTPLVPTSDTIVSTRRLSGIKSIDNENLTATFGAGTKLGQIGEPLTAAGQMLKNMPDIDEQTLAGSIGTATHGSGATLGALHSTITELQLATPGGDILRCSESENVDLFKASQVSLGSLGIITELTLQNSVAKRMERRTWMQPFDEMLEQFEEHVAENYSFEMYFVPFLDSAVGIAINPTTADLAPRTEDPDSDSLGDMKTLRNVLGWWPGGRRWLMNKLGSDYPTETNVDDWYKIFPSEREVRFNEMEYHMDRSHLVPTIRKVKSAIEKHHNEVFFPCEVRTVKRDDAWLSPFHGHESGSIAVHRYFEEDPRPLFDTIEPIYQPINGRPHWGKIHQLDRKTLATRYPEFERFNKLRAELDPQGKMLNAHLSQLFGA